MASSFRSSSVLARVLLVSGWSCVLVSSLPALRASGAELGVVVVNVQIAEIDPVRLPPKVVNLSYTLINMDGAEPTVHVVIRLLRTDGYRVLVSAADHPSPGLQMVHVLSLDIPLTPNIPPGTYAAEIVLNPSRVASPGVQSPYGLIVD